MNNIQSIMRSLVTYAICLPLAVFLGYVLTDPMQRSTFITMSLVLGLLAAPLLLKLHYPLMLLIWNTTVVAFFIPGRPQLWLAAIALSFGISFTQRIMNKEVSMIHVPELTRPLILLGLVVVVTAEMRGGFGLRAYGGDVFGGKRYVYLLLAIVGYFALTAQRIPRERVKLYVALFFLGSASCMIGDLYPILGRSVPFIFWLVPAYTLSDDSVIVGISRLSGTTGASTAFFTYMMARYGIRGIFLEGRPLRLIMFLLLTILGMYGGYRSVMISFVGVFIVQFFLEGLHHTKLLPTFILIGAVLGSLALPFAAKLPPTVQRTLAFLPVTIDPLVRRDAEASSEWRLRMWKAVLPQVPEYLLLGKGLAMTQADMAFAEQFQSRVVSEDQIGSALAGDYHSGPLSIVIPFGIWGLIAFVWFLAAGYKILLRNYRYGDPALKVVNGMLLASFIVKTFMFWVIVGGLYGDMLTFAGWLGLSVALNGGVARPSPAVVQPEPLTEGFTRVLPARRPAFGR